MPTRGDAITSVARRFGTRTDIDTAITDALEYAEEFVLAKGPELPRFSLELVNTQGSSGTFTYSLDALEGGSASLVRVAEDGGVLWAVDAASAPTVKLLSAGYNENFAKFQGAASASSTHYSIVGRKIYLFPTPDANFELFTFGYHKGTTANPNFSGLASSGTNLWLTHAFDWLVAEASMRVSAELRDVAGMQVFQQEAQMARARVFQEDIRKLYPTDPINPSRVPNAQG